MNKKRIWDGVLLSLMGVTLLSFTWQNKRLRGALADAQKKDQVDVDQLVFEAQLGLRLPQMKLFKMEGEESVWMPFQKKEPFTLFILITPYDCTQCFLEIPFWNAIEGATGGKVSVIAIIGGENKRQCEQFARKLDLKIPILHDRKNLLFKTLKIDDSGLTPLKVLLNKDGVILAFQRATMGENAKQADFMDLLLERTANQH